MSIQPRVVLDEETRSKLEPMGGSLPVELHGLTSQIIAEIRNATYMYGQEDRDDRVFRISHPSVIFSVPIDETNLSLMVFNTSGFCNLREAHNILMSGDKSLLLWSKDISLNVAIGAVMDYDSYAYSKRIMNETGPRQRMDMGSPLVRDLKIVAERYFAKHWSLLHLSKTDAKKFLACLEDPSQMITVPVGFFDVHYVCLSKDRQRMENKICAVQQLFRDHGIPEGCTDLSLLSKEIFEKLNALSKSFDSDQ